MITGSPFYPFLLARKVKRQLKRPVILDFQDPWVSKWGATRTPLTKAWAAHQVATWLEPIAVDSADFITSVSERQNDEFSARYPAFPQDRLAAIPIGGDANDYTYLRAHPLAKREVLMPRDAINISYVGTMLPRSEPLVGAVFSAVAKLAASDEQWVHRLRLNFVGTSNQPSGFGAFKITALAEKYGIRDFVSETPQRVPYLQALDLLANSHALILIGSDEPHYTASKIYPALLSGRPILALFHRASSACEILQRSGGARVIGFDTHEELSGTTDAIANALREIALTPQALGIIDQIRCRWLRGKRNCSALCRDLRPPRSVIAMRLAIVSSHPIQYYAPIFRMLDRRLDLEVFYAHRATPADQAKAGFGTAFEWDVDLLDGYRSRFMTNVAKVPTTASFFGCDTPEIAHHIRTGKFDAVLVLGWYLKSFVQAIVAGKAGWYSGSRSRDSQLMMSSNPAKTLI